MITCHFLGLAVLGNLTALKILDLSHNEITEFPKGYFGPPKNLTELYMSDNKIHRLPLEELMKLKSQIKLIDIRNNELGDFYPELYTLLENGTNFKFAGITINSSFHFFKTFVI